MEISIVIPVYNEQAVLLELRSRLLALVDSFYEKFQVSKENIEIIFVNDGSRDQSLPILIDISKSDKVFKVLNLSRNFGHQIAVTAGVEHAKGRAVVLSDADLQDPPEFILDLYGKYKEGFDVVYAIRKQRKGESAFKLATAKLFYRLIRSMTNIEIPLDTGDFRIMSRRVVDALSTMQEKHRFLRGMVSWVGFRQTGLEYERRERFAGETKYPLTKMIKLAWDALTSFSTVPLRLVSYLGIIIALLGFTYSAYVVYLKIFTNETISGWSSLMIAVLIMAGIHLITLGVMGEYIGRISEESKSRPLYFIENFYNGEKV